MTNATFEFKATRETSRTEAIDHEALWADHDAKLARTMSEARAGLVYLTDAIARIQARRK